MTFTGKMELKAVSVTLQAGHSEWWVSTEHWGQFSRQYGQEGGTQNCDERSERGKHQ